MGEYLLSIFYIPYVNDVRLTVLPLTDDATGEFQPMIAGRQALTEALTFLELHKEGTELPNDGEPLQLNVTGQTITTLLALLGVAQEDEGAERYESGISRQ